MVVACVSGVLVCRGTLVFVVFVTFVPVFLWLLGLCSILWRVCLVVAWCVVCLLGCDACNVLVGFALVWRRWLRFLGVFLYTCVFLIFRSFFCVMLVTVFWLVFMGSMFLDGTN